MLHPCAEAGHASVQDALDDSILRPMKLCTPESPVTTRYGRVVGPLALAQYTPTPEYEVEATPDGLAFRGRNPQRLDSVFVPWRELRRLQAIEPWPLLHLRSAARGTTYEETYGPFSRALHSVIAFENAVLRVIAAARHHAPRAVFDGWDVVEPQPWEPVDQLPTNQPARAPDAGALFRANARPHDAAERLVVASREHIAPFGWLAVLLFGRGQPGFNSLMPREARITASRELYVRWQDGRCGRLPVRSVRTRVDLWSNPAGGSRDTLYTFGRATYLILPDADSCPVAAVLDDTLRGGTSGSKSP
jgi:hypothetical protein